MIKIRLGGWAGQGIALAGKMLATSLALEQDMFVAQTRSYSAAVRSSISYSDVIADSIPLDELVVDVPDYLVVLYQKTLDQWEDMARDAGTLIIDSTRVKAPERERRLICIPAGSIAEEIGSPRSANMVLLGALAGCSPDIDLESLERTVGKNMSTSKIEANLKALQRGYDMAKKEKP